MHALLVRHCDYLSTGLMRGKLYDAGGYPGVIESDNPADQVFGEVYTINNKVMLLPRLDHYEGCGDRSANSCLFIRKKMPVTLPDGERVIAWAYLYNRDVSDLHPIKSGDYLEYLKQSNHKR